MENLLPPTMGVKMDREEELRRKQWKPLKKLSWVSRTLHFFFCPSEKKTFVGYEEQSQHLMMSSRSH